jgi:hypothetical protein
MPAVQEDRGVHPGVAAGGEDRALGFLRLAWGGGYCVCLDDDVDLAWMAWPIADGTAVLAGRTADELNRAIRTHWVREGTP